MAKDNLDGGNLIGQFAQAMRELQTHAQKEFDDELLNIAQKHYKNCRGVPITVDDTESTFDGFVIPDLDLVIDMKKNSKGVYIRVRQRNDDL